MIAWALDALIGVTVAMLIVLAVRRPVALHCGAGWAYALWLMPLLRLVMPDLDLLGGAAAALPQTILIVVPAAAAAAPALASAAPAAAAATGPTDWLMLLLALWAGGAAMFAMWQQSAYSAFLLSLGNHCRPGRPPIHGGIPVVESGAVDGPLAIGLARRRIVVPLDFDTRYSPSERRLALDHELVHHRRGDIFWNYVALAVLAVNWFNPVAWIAFRAFRTDQELACDAAVSAREPAAARLDYALALVKSASRPGEIAACPMNRADQLKRRLRMIALHRRSRLRSAGGALALATLLAGGLALSSPGFAQEEESAPSLAEIVTGDGAGAAAITGRRDAAMSMAACAPSAPEATHRYLSFPERRARLAACAGADPAVEVVEAVEAVAARSMARARIQPAAVRPTMLSEARAAVAEARAAVAGIRADAVHDAADARRDAADARRDTIADASAARAEAAAARREARAEAGEARREALAEAAEARREAMAAAAEARAEAAAAAAEIRQAHAEHRAAMAEAAAGRREALVQIRAAQGAAKRFRVVMVPHPPAPPPALLDAQIARELGELGREIDRELAPLREIAATL